MSLRKQRWSVWTAGAAGLVLSAAAHASSTWIFDSPTSATMATQAGTDYVDLAGMTGLSAANNGSNGFANGATWAQEQLTYETDKGLGMSSGGDAGSPYNRFDNNGTTTEALMLRFSSSLVLTSIGIQRRSGDADISLFRYVGNTSPVVAPTIVGTGAKLTDMNAAGWDLVSNYANLSNDDNNPYNFVNQASSSFPSGTGSSLGSSWWLITVYNSSYGSGTNLGQGNDYFKIYAVAGRACTVANADGSINTDVCGPDSGGMVAQVSEPASIALVSIGLLGIANMAARRRRRAV